MTHSPLRDALGGIAINLPVVFGRYKSRSGAVFPGLIRYLFTRAEL